MLIGFKKFLRMAGCVLLSAVFVVLFAGLILANEQLVAVSFWSWTSGSFNLSLVIFVAFFAGVCSGVAFCLLAIFRLTLRNQSLQRKLKRRDAEVQKLRVSALRGLSS